MGWYNIRFTLWAFDYELPVRACCSYLSTTEEGVPTHVVAQMSFEGGRSASFMASFLSAFRNNAEVFGEQATLFLEDFVVTSKLESASSWGDECQA